MFKQIVFSIAFAVSLFASLPQPVASDSVSLIPQTPEAGIATSTPQEPVVTVPISESDQPITLKIPSIGLIDPIVPVGINAKGEMAVPNGKTTDIGWYKYGPKPGEEGSAVLDAHVFAALKNLKNVPVGADIYVVMESGAVRHFIVRQSTVYPLTKLSPRTLFKHGPGHWLNIITCAGSLTADRSTYTHRLIVFAELIS